MDVPYYTELAEVDLLSWWEDKQPDAVVKDKWLESILLALSFIINGAARPDVSPELWPRNIFVSWYPC